VELIGNNFISMPAYARETFMDKFLALLDSKEVPAAIKIKWNDIIKSVLLI